MIRHVSLRPSRAVSSRTAAQKTQSLHHIAVSELDPPVIDRSLCTPMGETLRCGYRCELVHPLSKDGVVSKERKHSGANRQANGQRRRMNQSLGFRDSCATLYQRAVGITETEEDIPQDRL